MSIPPPGISRTPSSTERSIDIDEADSIRRFNRTPRPYFHDHLQVQQDVYDDTNSTLQEPGDETSFPSRLKPHDDISQQPSVTGSESGTEADDEKPSFVKALPPALLRPRKGLKSGELNEDALLTPSQLDDEGRRLDTDYWTRSTDLRTTISQEEEEAEQEKLRRRRLAEFARRTSEVALMAVMILCVLCGKGVRQEAWRWRFELLCHILTIVVLILAYPLKLSVVDTQATHNRVWERFRVPASFDPATVLYPPLLPVLVALTVSPSNSATILPNIILGLASLPQRLFPRSSRLGGFNALHWFVCILPLVIPKLLGLQAHPPLPGYSLTGEALVSLYPLHYALLQPLHYLTQTSLLVSELHLLAVVLINLLLLAQSPQIVILKACLWIGGATVLALCAPVLHWNLTLVRIPKWKLRRPGHSAEERKSLVDAVTDLISLQCAAGAFHSRDRADSDADEDEPSVSIKIKTNGLAKTAEDVSLSAVEPPRRWDSMRASFASSRAEKRARSVTLANTTDLPPTFNRKESPRKKSRSHVSWYLRLTPDQAQRRKWLYSGYVYFCIIAIILGPVQIYTWRKALGGHNPIAWAITYMAGQLPIVRDIATSLGLWNLFPWPPPSSISIFQFPSPSLLLQHLTLPLSIPTYRLHIGESPTRILLLSYWALTLLFGLLLVLTLTHHIEVDTRRKIFHGVMVCMLLPSIFIDPCCCALALAIILTIFLLLEVIRAGQVYPLGNAIGRFVAPYVDGRDLRGPVVVSHIFLLIGCAVPLWFSLAAIPRSGTEPWVGWELEGEKREVAMVAGVVCVGMGDAAASLIGRRYGRRKWIWVGGKSLEGSAAFAGAVTVGLMGVKGWEVLGGWADVVQGEMGMWIGERGFWAMGWVWAVALVKAVVCACGASFMEAVLTGANDNVVVPIALWLLVKGVRL